MNELRIVLIVKIALTFVLWAAPLLLAPKRLFQYIGIPIDETLVFARLLGMAFATLCIGYAAALMEVLAGRQPLPTLIYMGIASNGGAAAVILFQFLFGGLGRWAPPARWLIGFSGFAAAAIAIALACFVPLG